jgi:hypothetical protein
MIRLSYEDLWQFLDANSNSSNYAEFMQQIVDIEGDEDAAPPLDPDEYKILREAMEAKDLVVICQGQEMSCDRPGGDDILEYISETANAAKLGLEIVTWYGPNAEAMAVGVKPGLLDLFEGEPGLDERQDAMDEVDAE